MRVCVSVCVPARRDALVCPISPDNYCNFDLNSRLNPQPPRCSAAAWLKRLSGPAVPSGQRVIRTCQLLRSTQAAMRVVQHDPLLLNLVNILTWIPQSLWTQLAAYEGGKPTRVCVIEKKNNNNSVGCFLLYTKRDGDVTGCPEACGLVDNELAASRLFIKEWWKKYKQSIFNKQFYWYVISSQ